ncbi:hypothetical protein TWF481_002015 [Arthrobotrys musiformis]|uniref:Uncharacterized protein n=1 Tax=Arthrobotrys musiformis TaxID=47236 RepID=A0AAV9VUX7_9PEZI
MHFSTLSVGTQAAVILAGLADLASAHCVFADAYGNAAPAVRGYGLGFSPNVKREGTYLFPQQSDVAVFSNKVVHDAWWKGQVTPATGYIGIKAQMEYLGWLEWSKSRRKCSVTGRTGLRTGIPKITPGGTLNVMSYQINLDGGGPFTCRLDPTATGQNWRPVQVITNCPGDAHSLNWPGIQKHCWFKIAIPKDVNCRGVFGEKKGITDICLVRCQNQAANGPFGGCIPVQQIRPVKKKVVATKKKAVSKTTVVKPAATKKPATWKPKPQVQPTKGRPQPPPKPTVVTVTVTKGAVVPIPKNGGGVKYSTVTKNEVITSTITQEVVVETEEPAPQVSTIVVYEDEEVEEEEDSYDIEESPENEDADKLAPKSAPATKKPTKEEIEAALGGENFDEETLKRLQDEKVNDEDQAALKKAAENKGKASKIDQVEEEPSYS